VSLPFSTESGAGLIVGNYLYLMGGLIERATIVGDGSLGAFAVAPGVSLATARARFNVFVADNYLYAVGGDGGLTTVERAVINADGTLGRFTNVSDVALTAGRAAAAGVVIRNRLYVLSGDGGTRPPLTSIDSATINPDGSLSNFAPTVSLAEPIP
jgi:hypothetical protein